MTLRLSHCSRTSAWIATAVVVVSIAFPRAALAEKPWAKLVPFRQVKVEANPEKEYVVGESQGPWMIMAHSFADDNAKQDAHDLALELRKDFKLEAWVHRQTIDTDEAMKDVRPLGVDQYGKPKKMKPITSMKFDEHVVLIGSFPDIDDPKCQETLKRVRGLAPKTLGGKGGADSETHLLRRWRWNLMQQASARTGVEMPELGPMYRAFVTRNPTLPKEEYAARSMDPFVKKINSDGRYSLLKNPGKYTLVIATFRGASAFKEEDFDRKVNRNSKISKLQEGAEKAARLSELLRGQGVEAYDFHDRTESLVAVGSFDEIGRKDANGRTELRPEIVAMIRQFEAEKITVKERPGELALKPRVIEGIILDVSPQIVHVPKETMADKYQD